MTMPARGPESLSSRFFAALSASARQEGANVGPWPDVTSYRFTRPTRPRWDEVGSLSVGIVGQFGTALTIVGEAHLRGQFHYAVLGANQSFNCRIVQASPHHPVLGVVLRIDPQVVRAVSANMRALGMSDGRGRDCAVSAADDGLVDTVFRFLGALSGVGDPRVAAPLHMRELVYRVLRRDQSGRLLRLAAQQSAGNPVAPALAYVDVHLAEALTVDTLAAQVNLSPSAFARAFREITGSSPHQYVKAARLDRARRLLDEGRGSVANVSRSVGYLSVSHFIKEFRNRFGVTPGHCVAAPTFRDNVLALR